MTVRNATCACGQLRVVCEGEPHLVSLCHCQARQRRTGSAFGVAAFFSTANVRVDGRVRDWRRDSDSGHPVAFSFCPDCGATVFWRPERKPGMVAVALGSFADPSFPAPTKSVWDEHRHPWVALSFPD